jgi:hypothetical protein
LRKFRFAAAAATAALAIAGCGGGSDNKTLSYSDFGKQADTICKDSNAETKPLTDKLNGDPKNDAAILDQLIPKLQAAEDKFKQLKPPPELKADYDNFISITDQQFQVIKTAQTQAKSGDQAAYVASIKSLKPLSAKSNEAASKLGSAECAK